MKDDKMLMVWDLYPNVAVQVAQERPQPTVYAIPFSHALTSIDAHASSDKEFLVADCKGSVYITDWKSDPENAGKLGIHNPNTIELIDPSTLVSSTGPSGSVAWRPDNADMYARARFCKLHLIRSAVELVLLTAPGSLYGISETYKVDDHVKVGLVFRTVVIIFGKTWYV